MQPCTPTHSLWDRRRATDPPACPKRSARAAPTAEHAIESEKWARLSKKGEDRVVQP